MTRRERARIAGELVAGYAVVTLTAVTVGFVAGYLLAPVLGR